MFWYLCIKQKQCVHAVFTCVSEPNRIQSKQHPHSQIQTLNQNCKLTHCLFAPSPLKFTVCPLSVCCLSVCVKHDCFGSQRNFVEWERVPQMSRTPLQLHSSAAPCACMDAAHTPSPVPALVWVWSCAPTNRPLNLTHIQHTHRHTQTAQKPPGVPPPSSDMPTECVSRHNSNRTTFESSPILRKPVGFPGANEMPARQMDMREPQCRSHARIKVGVYSAASSSFLTFDGLFGLVVSPEPSTPWMSCYGRPYVQA